MMTGMERLNAAIQGTAADRIPVFCNLLDQGAAHLGLSLKEYYSNGENVATAQLLMREKYGYDNLWSLFYVGKEAELLGCRRIIFANDGPPNVGEMIIKSLDDIQQLQVPEDVASHPAFQEELKCLRILRREAGGRYPICCYVTATMTLPALLMGMERWMDLLFCGPDDLREELLKNATPFLSRRCRPTAMPGRICFSIPIPSAPRSSCRCAICWNTPCPGSKRIWLPPVRQGWFTTAAAHASTR